MKILVISLLRLGDLLMTVPALRAIRQRYPDAQLDLLVNRSVQVAEPLISFVNRIHFFDRDLIQESLGEADRPVFEGYDRIQKLVSRINREKYTVVYNLTHNRLSGYLASLIHAEEHRGLTLNVGGQASFGSPWFEYLNDYVTAGGREIFHCSDVFLYGCGADPRDGRMELRETDSGRRQARRWIVDQRPYILVQALTSDSKKNWSTSSLVQALAEFHTLRSEFRIVLIGAPFEAGTLGTLEEECRKRSLPVELALCDLPTALSLIRGAALLVTGDTSIKHLAAATETPIVEISLGSSDYRKTGVYRDNCVILQSRETCAPCSHALSCHRTHHACGERIRPEIVALTMVHLLDGHWPALRVVASEWRREVNLLITHFTRSGFWMAVPAGGDIDKWMLNRWIERSTWKMVLQREHLKPIGEYGTEGLRIKQSLDTLWPGLRKDTWNDLLTEIEFETSEVDNEIFELNMALRRAVRMFGEERAVRELIENLKTFCEDHEESPALTSYLMSLSEGSESPAAATDLRRIRRVQNYLLDISHRTQIKGKLIRSLKSHLMME